MFVWPFLTLLALGAVQTLAEAATCADTDGIPGIQSNGGTVCCLPTCIDGNDKPQCGGSGCSQLEGGSAGCCVGIIIDPAVDNICDVDVTQAPCVIDLSAPTTAAPTTPAPTEAATCADTDGIPGVQDDDGTVCCLPTCIDGNDKPKCGGPGCAGREGGSPGCCVTAITLAVDNICDVDVTEAPCVIDL